MGELQPRDGDADPTPNERQQVRLRRSVDQPENGSRERPGPSGCDRWLIGRASWSRTSPAARPWPITDHQTVVATRLTEALAAGIAREALPTAPKTDSLHFRSSRRPSSGSRLPCKSQRRDSWVKRKQPIAYLSLGRSAVFADPARQVGNLVRPSDRHETAIAHCRPLAFAAKVVPTFQ
jgi:hypothetical protein